ncbi:MAG: M3 family oligoendopeptidase [Chloroflexi bacterium]|nr:M3 family oligoendopeptidase [Chloroflexota bacterium]
MFSNLPTSIHDFMRASWNDIEPFYGDLQNRRISAQSVTEFLADWTRLADLVGETHSRLNVATTVNTTDKDAEQRLFAFLENIRPRAQSADQKLKQKFLESGLEPTNFEIPTRNLRSDAELFREKNLPLLTQESKLETEYDKIIGAQTVMWEGAEITVSRLRPVYQDADRAKRARAWQVAIARQMQDRAALNALWQKFLALRRDIATNADQRDYRAWKWQQLLRFDYTPDNCKQFHAAIERAVVPAATRVYEKRRAALGLKSLRPWDLQVDPLNRPPLRPFANDAEMQKKTAKIFQRVDPQLGEYFEIMRREHLLDLDNRKGKAPGGYCTGFAHSKRPFIFANAVGLHGDVQTLLHEAGHAFHNFERNALPYHQQRRVTSEFSEVASMGMELLASPYLSGDGDAFYNDQDAARARADELEKIILFWPYMAVVDAFQHWVYENPDDALDANRCDEKWAEQWDRFMRGFDWSGMEEEKKTGWHRKLHIFQVPFYYVEYWLAQLGAVQVWANALQDQARAVKNYRAALALGGTRSIPELFRAAGATFAFDAETLGSAVTLIESQIEKLEKI